MLLNIRKFGNKCSSFLERRFNIIGVLPATLVMFFVIIYPLVYLIRLSLTNTSNLNLVSGTEKFVGLSNFVQLFSDKIFTVAIGNTLIFTVVSTTLTFVFGLGMALLVLPLSKTTKNVVLTLLLIPSMVADIAVGLMGSSLLDQSTGILDYILNVLGLPSVAFLGDANVALWTVIGLSVWQFYPYMFLFSLAGLESLNENFIEAAKLEGCSSFKLLTRIQLPLIMPILSVALFFRITSSIRVFDKIYIMTGGGPGSATETISTYIQRIGFLNFRFGLASAGGVVLLLMAMLLGIVSLRYMYGNND